MVFSCTDTPPPLRGSVCPVVIRHLCTELPLCFGHFLGSDPSLESFILVPLVEGAPCTRAPHPRGGVGAGFPAGLPQTRVLVFCSPCQSGGDSPAAAAPDTGRVAAVRVPAGAATDVDGEAPAEGCWLPDGGRGEKKVGLGGEARGWVTGGSRQVTGRGDKWQAAEGGAGRRGCDVLHALSCEGAQHLQRALLLTCLTVTSKSAPLSYVYHK